MMVYALIDLPLAPRNPLRFLTADTFDEGELGLPTEDTITIEYDHEATQLLTILIVTSVPR